MYAMERIGGREARRASSTFAALRLARLATPVHARGSADGSAAESCGYTERSLAFRNAGPSPFARTAHDGHEPWRTPQSRFAFGARCAATDLEATAEGIRTGRIRDFRTLWSEARDVRARAFLRACVTPGSAETAGNLTPVLLAQLQELRRESTSVVDRRMEGAACYECGFGTSALTREWVEGRIHLLLGRALAASTDTEARRWAFEAYWWMIGAGLDVCENAVKAQYVLHATLRARGCELPLARTEMPPETEAMSR